MSDSVIVHVQPNKSFYKPQEPVELAISCAQGVEVHAKISYLADEVITLRVPLTEGIALLQWTPPAVAPRGYGVDMNVMDAQGQVIATANSAFDVLERWTQAPRYGFLTEFTSARHDSQETMALMAKHHVNGLQFYDWQYRHEQLMPPAETADDYSDLLGRTMSLKTVHALIDTAHAYSIAAMPYTAIYGASSSFYDANPDMALYDTSGSPFRLGADYLVIMNPASGSAWENHLLKAFAEVLDNTCFDGIHIDQYGAPMHGHTSEDELIRLEDTFPTFINATHKLVKAKRGAEGATIFNNVRNWPLATVAPVEGQDAVYIEVWEPYSTFLDLHRIVTEARNLSGEKPVIIPAYIHPDEAINVRLAHAMILASGGYQLQLGEPRAMLADPYFPKFGLMDEAMQAVMQRHYDFTVRYENVLALGTVDVTPSRARALKIAGIQTDGLRSKDRVAVIVRSSETTEAFSLINLMGIDHEYWNVALTSAPTPHTHIKISLDISKPVQRVYATSPDQTALHTQPIDFETHGNTIQFTLTELNYWTLIVVEYVS